MIHKPVNPYPHNRCVDLSDNLKVEYELPSNEKVDGRYISINSLETGEVILDSYEDLETPTNKVEWDVRATLSEHNNNEYSWNSFYWQTPTKEPNPHRVTR